MVIFLYSNKEYENQVKSCIRSLTHKMNKDLKIVYYTIGFKSDFEFPNLYKVEYPVKSEYKRFHFYKAELSLVTMDMFPNEYYAFTDTDVLFSRRFDPDKVKHSLTYPMGSYGPHEYPYIWETTGDGTTTIYDEKKMMKYFNVPERSQRYLWSCFYSFNPQCRDFFEEYTSICINQYLQNQQKEYFPYADETAFNICLWKRNATQNFGFAFVNTHLFSTVKAVEESTVSNARMGNAVDAFGVDWEYVQDPEKILLYHGFKKDSDMLPTLDYLLDI